MESGSRLYAQNLGATVRRVERRISLKDHVGTWPAHHAGGCKCIDFGDIAEKLALRLARTAKRWRPSHFLSLWRSLKSWPCSAIREEPGRDYGLDLRSPKHFTGNHQKFGNFYRPTFHFVVLGIFVLNFEDFVSPVPDRTWRRPLAVLGKLFADNAL
jgi:hypothetical protein